MYRIDLEEGRFVADFHNSNDDSETNANYKNGANTISISPSHRMIAVGMDSGHVNFYDSRTKTKSLNPFVSLNVASATRNYGFDQDESGGGDNNSGVVSHGNPNSNFDAVTATGFNLSGLNLACGTSRGNVALYDVRTSNPMYVKEHQYGLPIINCLFHEGTRSLMSADKKVIKVWKSEASGGMGFDESTPFNLNLGSVVCNIEAASPFTHFSLAGDGSDPSGKDYGLVLASGEQTRVQAFYAPVLGVAPNWCSFLDNVTEELEEKDLTDDANAHTTKEEISVYEDYKFITREEVSEPREKLLQTKMASSSTTN